LEPAKFNIEDIFGYALHHASYTFRAAMKEKFRTADLNVTVEEFIFLFLIPKEGAPQSLLTKKSLKDKTTITRLVDRLVTKGWITRAENAKNRREQLISLTPDGLKMKQKLFPIIMEYIGFATRGIEKEEIERTRLTLNKIVANLTS